MDLETIILSKIRQRIIIECFLLHEKQKCKSFKEENKREMIKNGDRL